jgi:hypothetical protein
MKIDQIITFPIYFSIFYLYKKIIIFKLPQISDVWFRNSFALGYWTFGKSDIDITVRIDNSSENIEFKVSHLHASLKSIFKIIGELVIVDLSPQRTQQNLIINSQELLRDPILTKFLSPALPTQNEKIIFLHKFICTNWQHHLQHKISTRKLKYYFDTLGISSSMNSFSFDELCLELGKLLQSPFTREIFSLYNDISFETKLPSQKPAAPYAALFFNKIYHTKLMELENIQLSSALLKLTIKWELWGAYSNQFFPGVYNFKTHIKKIILAARPHLQPDDYLELLDLATGLNLIESN